MIQQKLEQNSLNKNKQYELSFRNAQQLYEHVVQPVLSQDDSLQKVFNSSLSLSSQKMSPSLVSYANLIRFQKALAVYGIQIQNILIRKYLSQKQNERNKLSIQMHESGQKVNPIDNIVSFLKLAFRKSSLITNSIVQIITTASSEQDVAIILSSAKNEQISLLICANSIESCFLKLFDDKSGDNKIVNNQIIYLSQILESILPTIQVDQSKSGENQNFKKIYQFAIGTEKFIVKLALQILIFLKRQNKGSKFVSQRRLPVQFFHLLVFLFKWLQTNHKSIKKVLNQSECINEQLIAQFWMIIFTLSTTQNKIYHSDVLTLLKFIDFPQEAKFVPGFTEMFMTFNVEQQHTIAISNVQDLAKYAYYLNRLIQIKVQPNLYKLISSIQYILVLGLNQGDQAIKIIRQSQAFQVLLYKKFVGHNILTKTGLFLLKNALKSLIKQDKMYLINLQVQLFSQIDKFSNGGEPNPFCLEVYACLNDILFLQTPQIKQSILKTIHMKYPYLVVHFQKPKMRIQQIPFNQLSFDKKIFRLYLDNKKDQLKFLQQAMLLITSEYFTQFWDRTVQLSKNQFTALSSIQLYLKITYAYFFKNRQSLEIVQTHLKKMLSWLFFGIHSQKKQIRQSSFVILQKLVQLSQFIDKQIFVPRQFIKQIYKAIQFYSSDNSIKILGHNILFTFFMVLKRKLSRENINSQYVEQVKQILQSKKQTKLLHFYLHDLLIEYSQMVENLKQGLCEIIYSRKFKLLILGLYSYLQIVDQNKQFELLRHLYKKSTEILAKLYMEIVFKVYVRIDQTIDQMQINQNNTKRKPTELINQNEVKVQQNCELQFEKLLSTDQIEQINIFQSCQSSIATLNKKYNVQFTCPKLYKSKKSESGKIHIRKIIKVQRNL